MALTDMQRRFAEAYANNGGNGAAAARAAGYAKKSERVEASRLLKHEEVLEEIRKHVKLLQVTDAPLARNTLRQLCKKARSEAVRRQSAVDLLNYAGLQIPEKHEFTIKDERTDEEIMQGVADQLGMPLEDFKQMVMGAKH